MALKNLIQLKELKSHCFIRELPLAEKPLLYLPLHSSLSRSLNGISSMMVCCMWCRHNCTPYYYRIATFLWILFLPLRLLEKKKKC